MFWKKKKASTDKFTHESSNKRGAFRFEFDKDISLEIEFKDKRFSVINLSATGMSFKNNELAIDDCGMSKIFFEFTNHTTPVLIEMEMQILRIDKNNICHGIYKSCSDDVKELIHKYILEKQKEKIRATKIK
ncbi:MAG: PilZ domain-containing protein [Desulfobacteraceae bacterium]|nr:PilZ domain-containing protein [Desulfobacteraceae bacterium]